MEIRNLPSGNADRPRNERSGDVIDFTRSNRERIADVVEEVEGQRLEKFQRPPNGAVASTGRDGAEDRLEVSVASRALSAEVDPTEAEKRQARIDELRAEIAAGALSTPERAEMAARKLLGG